LAGLGHAVRGCKPETVGRPDDRATPDCRSQDGRYTDRSADYRSEDRCYNCRPGPV
jgi:hypothetical protein